MKFQNFPKDSANISFLNTVTLTERSYLISGVKRPNISRLDIAYPKTGALSGRLCTDI